MNFPKEELQAQEKICVVLASTGHPNLERVLVSITNQLREKDQLIIIDNSSDGLDDRLSSIPIRNLIYIRKTEKNGAASAYNLGLSHEAVRASEYVAIASDDDVWEPDKLKIQLRAAKSNRIQIGSAWHVKNEKKQIKSKRPKQILVSNESILKYAYGGRTIFRNPHHIPAATIFFPSKLASLKFRDEWKIREDIWWLYEGQKKGFEIVQLEDPLVTVVVDYEKDVRRASIEEGLKFSELLPFNLRTPFLVYHGPRSRIAAGNLRALLEWQRFLRQAELVNVKVESIFLLQILICVFSRRKGSKK